MVAKYIVCLIGHTVFHICEHGVLFVWLLRVAMQVMKFGDRRVATDQHFAVGLPRNGCQCRGVDSARELIHALAPGPETVTPGRRSLLRVAGQCALEGMAVRIAKTRDNEAGLQVMLQRAQMAPDIYARARPVDEAGGDVRAAALADLDGDGDIDIVVASRRPAA